MDLDPYLETLRRRDRSLVLERRERALNVRARLPDVTRILVEEFSVRRVVLFGSLCFDELDERSDLDLAVEGLRPEDYWRALDRVTRAAGLPVDLVPLEEASPSLRSHIDEAGEPLHG